MTGEGIIILIIGIILGSIAPVVFAILLAIGLMLLMLALISLFIIVKRPSIDKTKSE